jgi:hypothetical protein
MIFKSELRPHRSIGTAGPVIVQISPVHYTERPVERLAREGADGILRGKVPRFEALGAEASVRVVAQALTTGAGTMFTIIRKFTLTPGSAAEVARRVQDSFVPLLRELPGFAEYFLLDGGPDVLVSIRVFDSAHDALASNEIAASWIRNNVLEFTRGMPEVMAGNVLVAAVR